MKKINDSCIFKLITLITCGLWVNMFPIVYIWDIQSLQKLNVIVL